MSAQDELVNLIATLDPVFYEELRTRQLPSGWTPDPAMTTQILHTMGRDECRACKKAGARLRCSVCKVARYCSSECQRIDMVEHKQFCAVDHGVKAALKEMLYAGHPDDT